MTYEEKKRLVLDFLSRPEHKGLAHSPTYIGLELFEKNSNAASSFTSPVCRRMVAEGLLIRDSGGWYRVKG